MLHCCIYYFFLHKKHALDAEGFSGVFLVGRSVIYKTRCVYDSMLIHYTMHTYKPGTAIMCKLVHSKYIPQYLGCQSRLH